VADARPRLLHVITTLSTGGAEVMLRNVVFGQPSRAFDLRVLSLTTLEPIGSEIARTGVPTLALGAPRGLLRVRHWRQLRANIMEWQPDLIHSWMYHSNVAIAIVLKTIPTAMRSRHVAAVRAAAGHVEVQSRTTRLVRRLDAKLSKHFDRLVFNAHSAREQHKRLGYDVERAVVIPNGFDTDKFRPVPESRSAVRHGLGVSTEPLVGIIGRYHPVKGHLNFIRAAAAVAARGVACKFVLVGAGCDGRNAELQRLLEQHGIEDRTLLLGERADVERLVSSLDVVVSASISESFPNAVGEAMACGVPCVVTDVGDCAYLVGDTGWVVPAEDPTALSTAIAAAVSSPAPLAAGRGLRARERIRARFSLERVVEQYRDLYMSALADRRTP
jgi:glycosyltransferase involved in cell wall biosynthesis